jgi:gliding motility-associated-like protein
MIKAKNIFTFLCLTLLISVKSQTIIYEDLFNSAGNGGTNTSTATINGVAPNNTNWRYVEFENSFGPSWEFGGGNAILSNSYGVNTSFGANMLYKGADGYYTAPGGLYEQSNNFTSIFKNNTSIIEWSINFRSPNEVPQGLTNGGAGFTGGAFVLGMESPTLRSCSYRTRGYAVIFGDASGAGNRVKLVHFIGGTTDNNCATNNQPHYTFFNWNNTNTTNCIISDNQNLTTSWYSVKVQYNPANDEWRLFVRNDGGSPQDPQTLNDTHCKGVNVNSNYTTTNLPILGLYACLPEDGGALRTVRYDNLRIKSNVLALGCPATTGLCGAYAACTTPTVTTQPATQAICSSGFASLTVAVNPSTGPFQWQYFDGTNWNNVANNTPTGFSYANQTTASLAITTTNASCGTYQYRVLAGSSGCQATSNSATLTVLKATRLAPTGPQCSETALNFDACPSGATYNWSVTTSAGTNASPLNGVGQTFSFTPVNNTGSSQTFSITANITFQGLTCTNNFNPTIVSPPISGTISASSVSICAGNTATLTTNGTPGGSWLSSNSSVATVNSSGIVSGVSQGSVTISYSVNATAPCTGSSISTLDINVTPAPEAGTLSGNSNLCIGTSTTITSNGNSGGTWTSSNTSIATVDANGNVNAISNGTAVITYSVTSASCNSSDIATYTLNVNSGTDAGTISSTATNICVGNTATVSTSGTIGGTWASSNTSVATIDANGIVTGISPGTIIITYSLTATSCSSLNNTATLSIDVIASPDAGILSGATSLCVGSTSTITSNGNNGGTWTSSNLSVATIDANGVVTGVSVGTITITYSVSSSSCNSSDFSTIIIDVTPGANAGNLIGQSTICTGNSTTLTSNGNSGGSWISSNPSVATINTAGIVTGISSGTSIITYSVSASGCTSEDTSTILITVNSTPIFLNLTNQTFCSGSLTSTINFNVQPSSAQISWLNSNTNIGLAGSGTGNISPFIGTSNGNSSLTSTITVSASSNGCISSTQNFNITIDSAPIISISGNENACVNGSINLLANGGNIYNWQGPNGFTSNSQNIIIPNATSNMSGVYTVSSGTAGTCQGSASITITVNSLPSVNATVDPPACIGGNINLNSNISNALSYSWAGPNNFSSNNANPVITNANSTMAGNYTITVQSNSGCFNASVVAVTLLPQPNSPSVSSVSLCQNETAIPLSAIPSNGGNLNWYGTNIIGGTAILNPPTPSTNVPGDYTFYVSQTVQGCESQRASINVTILPVPNGIINPIPPKCAPTCNSFILSSPYNIVQYQWNMGNGFANINNDTIIYCYQNEGSYSISIKLTDASGCINTIQFNNWVNVYENPTAGFSSEVIDGTFVSPEVQFQNQSSGTNITSYNWNFGDQSGLSTTQLDISHIFENTGTYTVTLIVNTNEGCSDTAKSVIELLEDFNVYIPNTFTPNDDDVNEEFFPIGTGISEKNYQMKIYDRWGELIFSTNNLNEHWKGLRKNGVDPVLQDTYIYKINLQSLKGNIINKVGQVKVIR